MPFTEVMELFLLLRKDDESGTALPVSVRDKYLDPGYVSRESGNHILFLNRKSRAGSCSQFSDDTGSAYGTGTFTYRKLCPADSLGRILHDMARGSFDGSLLFGHYYIFLFTASGIDVLTDATGLVKSYHDTGGTYLSSSFLLAAELHERLTLNRTAVIENLLTGGITGDETPVVEIISFTRSSVRLFPGIRFHLPVTGSGKDQPVTRKEALERQSHILDTYFSSFAGLAETSGADIGLTGGYDSRLLLAYARRHYPEIRVHSHYREVLSAEWIIARQIADAEKIPFCSPEVLTPYEMDDGRLLKTIDSAFRFYDGLIRMHCSWLEEYNTLEYRMNILGNGSLGFNGIGGEQYRNHDRLYGKPWLFSQWLRYYYLRRNSGRVILGSKAEKDLLERMRVKICRELGFAEEKRWIGLYDLKRLQNEILIPAYRGARTDAENRHSYFLTPFADAHVSSEAMQAMPFLGDSKAFETEMIRAADPSLASYPTGYGYDLLKGEPWLTRAVSSGFENLLPGSLKWMIRYSLKRGSAIGRLSERVRSSGMLKELLRNVMELNLPLSLHELLRNEGTAHRVLSLGYLVDKINIKE